MSNEVNPFAAGAAAIQKRAGQQSTQVAPRRSNSVDLFEENSNLPARRHQKAGGLDMFAESPKEVEYRAPAPAAGLPCQDVWPDDDQGYKPVAYCVGPRNAPHKPEKIRMEQSQFMNADGDMDVELVLAVYEGVCHECTLIHHHSVSHLVDPGAYR